MASKLKIKVNGLVHNVTASLDTPLLYVLHNELHLHGPALRLRARAVRCLLGAAGRQGDPFVRDAGRGRQRQGDHDARGHARPLRVVARHDGVDPGALHPLQQAWIDVQVPHCGYCQNGMMIQAADLLATTKRPTEAQIRTAMNGHLCRCGTYPRILTAIQKAAAVMAKGAK